MSECTASSCSGCAKSGNCPSQKKPVDFLAPLHPKSKVKKVIGVVSGKGGVGKSLVTSMLAVSFARQGYKTAILDADLTGPSIPSAFGLTEKAQGDDTGLYPVQSKMGISVLSINLLLEDEKQPVVWRGPVISGVIKQFWSEAVWQDIDIMFIDMPPGTGDVPLTVFQSIPVDGIVVVTSPQQLVGMIVGKAVNMAKMMNVPIIGLVENYSYFKCPGCDKKYAIFGDSHIDETAKEFRLPVLGRIPINPEFPKLFDKGLMELFESDALDAAVAVIESLPTK